MNKPSETNTSAYPMLDIDRKELKKCFDQAESTMKKIENIGDEVSIASINQLRYAGRHLIDALNSKEEEYKHEINEVKAHCLRASFDAAEVGIAHCLKEIKCFREDYRKIPLTGVISKISEYMAFVDIVAEKFVNQNSSVKNREKYKDQCLKDFEKLYSIHQKLESSREEINKLLSRRRNKIFYIVFGTAIATIAATAGIVSVIMNYYFISPTGS